ncbi:uncharacterized protein ACNS7B_013626 [Menidia menidia]
MSTNAGSSGSVGFYSKLIDNEGTYDELSRAPDVQHSDGLVPHVAATSRLSRPGLFRITTIGLSVLCAVLLISIIAVAAGYKNKTQGSGDASLTSNLTALKASIDKLQQENQQLQKEKEELLAKPTAKVSTKAPAAIEPTPKTTQAQIVCPMDWHLFQSNCYLISRQTRNWKESQAYCQRQGAYLAVILTAEEQTFLWDLLPRGHWNAYWFGITDGETEDQWKWIDGTPLVGGFWEDGEPNNHINEDCGYIVKTSVLERVAIKSWIDAPCEMYLPFICEKEMNSGTNSNTPQ